MAGNSPEVEVFSCVLSFRMEIDFKMEVSHPALFINELVGVRFVQRLFSGKKRPGESLPFPARAMDNIAKRRFDF